MNIVRLLRKTTKFVEDIFKKKNLFQIIKLTIITTSYLRPQNQRSKSKNIKKKKYVK